MKKQPKNQKIRIAPKKEYDNFRKYFAFSCIDMVIFDGKSVLLTKRTRDPYKGYWHLPGSMIHKDEKMTDTVRRSAKEELGLDVKIRKFVGVYESLNTFRHDVSHGFVVSINGGQIKTDHQSSDLRFFARLPSKIIPHHRALIKDALKHTRNDSHA
ncbi:NUDIX domain-containing protein [Candidatus Nitrosotenuis chungbukensis]|uniref:NUDIX hydrolase n=1 Tax=Candidatus Nitrosotenuis chungbukensis TaxID=1353246 RepID=UPI00069425C7|nr:NUDIX domain-containing protein [Candidatus Nitrosotenuis chungbukensis]WKT57475.1 NUDIX domain-containing protein [Candidatus Nitrosotenuis chungbukensis]